MKVTRSMFYRYRQQDAIATRERNGKKKRAELARRDARMKAILADDSQPYTPEVMSWLSRQLKKPSTKITPEDVKSLIG
jgi:hypothetical protein